METNAIITIIKNMSKEEIEIKIVSIQKCQNNLYTMLKRNKRNIEITNKIQKCAIVLNILKSHV